MELSEDYLNDLSIINKIDNKDDAYTWLLRHGHGITTANLVLSYWKKEEKHEPLPINYEDGIIVYKDFGAEEEVLVINKNEEKTNNSIIKSIKNLVNKKGNKK